MFSDANNGWWPVKTGKKMKIPVTQNQNFIKTPVKKWKGVKTIVS